MTDANRAPDRFVLHGGQLTGEERQQLLHRVEASHVAGDQMLDASFPDQGGLWGLVAKLHHKGAIGRERSDDQAASTVPPN